MVEHTLILGQRRLITADVAFEATVPVADQRQAPVVFAIFMLVQALDGILTYWGVTRFGIDLELNALLASLMLTIGPAATLVAAKSLACACGVLLYVNGYFRALAALSGLCLGLAVLPWLYLWAHVLRS